MAGSPCREPWERHLSLHLSVIPEEEAPPSPATSHMTTPLSPPPPSPLPPPPIPPPWDRTCDAGFSTSEETDARDEADAWQHSVSLMYSIFGREHPRQTVDIASSPPSLLQLPTAIRLQIYRHVVSSTFDRSIRLNPQVFTRAVWPLDTFDSLAAAFSPLQGALSISFALRAEVLAAFWQTRRIHVVFSPYVRPAVCPLATLYLQRYAGILSSAPNVTLELDCTRLGYGMHPAAAGLQPGLLSMGALVEGFVDRLAAGQHSLKSLTVLCRRYYGNRPAGPASDATGEVPYVGPEVEQVAAQLGRLAGRVRSARFIGFSESFTTGMLNTLNGRSQDVHDGVHIQLRSPSDMYPLLPGHSAYVDCGSDVGICLSTHSALAPSICVRQGEEDDDAKTMASTGEMPDAHVSLSSSSSSSSSSSLSSASLVLPLTPLKLHVPSLTLSLDLCPHLAVLSTLSGIKRGGHNRSRKRPPPLTLLGFCGTRPGSFVAERLAAAGLVVSVVGSPLRLADGVDDNSVVGEAVEVVDEKMDIYLGQEPRHRQSWAGTMAGKDRQARPRRRLQKRR